MKVAFCKKSIFSLAGLTLAIMSANHVIAQVQQTEPLKKLKTVVVISKIESESLHNNSQVITQEEIENRQVNDWDDLVRYTPGVSVSDIGRFGANGFNIRGLDGDRVAITIDGLSFGETLDPASYQAYDFFRSTRGGLDIDALKSVEIIKGADSIATGSGGLSGGVLFVTKDPDDYLSATGNDIFSSVKSGYSSDNSEVMLSGTLAGRLNQWEGLMVVTHRQGQELNVYGSGEDISGAGREIADPLDTESINGLTKIFYHITDKQKFGLVIEHYQADTQLNNLSRVDATYLSRNADDENSRERIGLQYDWLASSTFFDTLEWRYDIQQSYSNGYTLMLFKSTSCPQGISPCHRSEDRDYEQNSYTHRLKFSKEITGNQLAHNIVYGLSGEQRDVSFSSIDTRYIGVTEIKSLIEVDPDFVPETDVDHYAFYLRDRVALQQLPLSFHAGIRQDLYQYSPHFNAQFQDGSATVNDVDFSKTTWQSGFNVDFSDHHQIGMDIGTGFKAPTTENLYYATVSSVAINTATNQEMILWDSVANPDLKPEESFNKEIHYSYTTNSHFFKVAVFHDGYDNFIETQNFTRLSDQVFSVCSRGVCTNVTGDTYTMPSNIGESSIKGLEIEGRVSITPSLSLRAAYSQTEGEKKNGTPLLSIVPRQVVVGFEYQPQLDWGASLMLTRSGAKKFKDAWIDSTNGLVAGADFLSDSYTVLDVQSFYQIGKNIKTTLGVYNLLDEQYWRWQRVQFVNKGTGGARGGISGDGLNRYAEPGRHFKLTFSYDF